jgi:hypothetical protein
MSSQEYLSLIRKHWPTYLPDKVAALKAQGRLQEAMEGAARLAQSEQEDLEKNQGYREHEAREVALAHHVYLEPEPGAGQPAWERKELDDLESQYQQNPPT